MIFGGFRYGIGGLLYFRLLHLSRVSAFFVILQPEDGCT